ncbi:MAG: ABC transporter ATP-binding protein [Candidatus Sumerlaeota bacterium]|nr:ABC transporter ATP-binding protein [Candidatus Sumerlaeota bacterium]
MTLNIDNISKQFAGPSGMVQALSGVSLSIDAGEFVMAQGASGCGKTTLLLAAGGLQQPSEGKISLEGEDVYALAPDRRSGLRADKIGFVFQQFHLIPYFTVLENILAPTMAKALPNANERAQELLRQFNMEARAHHTPDALSVGERQRTALARAMLNRPKLLLADEPTGNLDEENGKIVLSCLANYAKEGGAVFLVTHDSRAAGYATRAFRMENGKILANNV